MAGANAASAERAVNLRKGEAPRSG